LSQTLERFLSQFRKRRFWICGGEGLFSIVMQEECLARSQEMPGVKTKMSETKMTLNIKNNMSSTDIKLPTPQ
jgi:hypothetical protein